MDLKDLLRQQWDRVGAWVCIVAGAMLLVTGWFGVSGNAYPAAQLPYIISAGIGGIFALGLGATLWISADLRDEWQKLDRIERALDRLAGTEVVRDTNAPPLELAEPGHDGAASELTEPAPVESKKRPKRSTGGRVRVPNSAGN